MRVLLRNDRLTVIIDSKGAEIKSVQKNGKEYMWQADPTYWGRTAPVLFPLVGSLVNKEFHTGGQTYSMGQHGFARDMEFERVSQTATSAVFRLNASEETLARFPYAFVLEIGYTLEGEALAVTWTVQNPAQTALPFSIGAHPAFLCSLEGSSFRIEEKVEGVLRNKEELSFQKLNASGTLAHKDYRVELKDGLLPINQALFSEDALIVPNSTVERISIVNEQGETTVSVDFQAPIFGLWSPAGKNAPFVCIEPWYGRCDAEDFAGTWEEREYGQTLAGGEVFTNQYTISFLA